MLKNVFEPIPDLRYTVSSKSRKRNLNGYKFQAHFFRAKEYMKNTKEENKINKMLFYDYCFRDTNKTIIEELQTLYKNVCRFNKLKTIENYQKKYDNDMIVQYIYPSDKKQKELYDKFFTKEEQKIIKEYFK